MSTVAIPLRSIAQQIEQHESELERLRQAYQTRQTQLAELRRRREELEAQLHQVDTEIEAVVGEAAAETPGSSQSVPVEAKSEESPTLSSFLVRVLTEVGQPMTIRQLADEVESRKFPTKSINIYHLVQNRVQRMAKKGLLNRAKGELGYVVGKATQDEKRRVQASPGKKIRPQKPASTKSSPHSPSNGHTAQRPLREVLLQLLKRSRRPLSARELAEQAQQAGYHSTSKSFIDVIWVTLPKLKGVERIEGKGYRLLSRPASQPVPG